MTTLLSLGEAAGWTLVHSLWQGALIASLLALLLYVMRAAGPARRHLAACAALLSMVVAVGLTWQGHRPVQPRTAQAQALSEIDLVQAALLTVQDNAAADAGEVPVLGSSGTTPSRIVTLRELEESARAMMPWLAALWAVGFSIAFLRLAHSAFLVWRAVRRGISPPQPLSDRFAELAASRGLGVRPRLLESSAVDVPTFVGSWRPTVLVPGGFMNGLSTAQADALLAHELEHIRRGDHRFTLLQALLEASFFYHPAVRWISRQIRTERELCCDEAAVSAAQDPREYARALAQLWSARRRRSSLGLAATDGGLLRRIRAILRAPPPANPRVWRRAVTGVVASAVVALALNALASATEDAAATVWAALPEAEDARWVWITVEGTATFDEEFREITSVHPRGRVVLEERRRDGARRIEATQDGEELLLRYFVDGQEVAFGDEAREWLTYFLQDAAMREEQWTLRALAEEPPSPSVSDSPTPITREELDARLAMPVPELPPDFPRSASGIGWDETSMYSIVHVGPRPTVGQRDWRRVPLFSYFTMARFELDILEPGVRVEIGPVRLAPEADESEWQPPYPMLSYTRLGIFSAHHLAAHDLIPSGVAETFLRDVETRLLELEAEAGN